MGNSEIWYEETAAALNSTITLTTVSTIPAGTSITITVYQDVGNDDTGGNSVTDPSGTTHNYENSGITTLSGGTETNDIAGFNDGGSTSAYIFKVELDGDGSDPSIDSPVLDELEADV